MKAVHMSKRGRYRSLLGFAVLAAVVCFAGTAAARSSKASALPTLRIGLPFSYDQFWTNPGLYGAGGAQESLIESLQFAPIFHMKPGGTITPGLATSWRAFSTGRGPNKDFEFTLRHDAKFADGTTVDANAVINWLNWYSATNTTYGGLLGKSPKFTAIGKWTVRAALEVPTPAFFTILSDGASAHWAFVASPACVAAPTTAFLKGGCGAGPFTLDSSVKGDHYDYVPNPYYYDTKDVKWGAVSYKVIVTPSSLLQAMQAGQLDIMSPGNDPATADAARSGGDKVYWANVGEVVVLLHAVTPPSALSDIRVRQALNYAIDRKAITDSFFLGYAKPTSEYITSDAFDPKYRNYYPYNPDKAKALLAAAGQTNLTFRALWVNPQQLTQLQALAKYLDAVGVHLTIASQTPADVQNGFNGVPMTYSQLTGETTTGAYLRWMSPGNRTNIVGSDNELNTLFYKGLKASNPIPIWKTFWDTVTKKAYFLPFSSLPLFYYASPNVGGINVSGKRTGALSVLELYPK